MTIRICSLLFMAALGGAPALAADLPAGHPQVSPSTQPALPPGHPPMPSGSGGLPPGHPSMPGGMGGQLPAGHPQVKPSTQPAATSATITIHAFQATKDAKALGAVTASIDLYHRGQIIKKAEPKLDDKGNAVADNLPILLPFQPVVTIKYGGVYYQAVGKPMDAYHATQQIDLPVYETTTTAPAWQIHMRHLMATLGKAGLEVTEMVGVENPTDRTWVATAAEGKRPPTISLPVPANAKDLKLVEGFDPSETIIADGKISGRAPLMPGLTRFRFTYVIPVKDGQSTLAITAPVTVKNMMVFIPDTGKGAKVEGIPFVGAHDMGHGKQQMYQGADIKPGTQTTITVPLPQAGADASGASAPSTSVVPKVIAGVGGVAILAVGAGLVFYKSPKAAKSE